MGFVCHVFLSLASVFRVLTALQRVRVISYMCYQYIPQRWVLKHLPKAQGAPNTHSSFEVYRGKTINMDRVNSQREIIKVLHKMQNLSIPKCNSHCRAWAQLQLANIFEQKTTIVQTFELQTKKFGLYNPLRIQYCYIITRAKSSVQT